MNYWCLSFLVGPGTNQDQMKCEHVVKPCKTLSRHPHFCLIVIQPRSATDRLTLNQTKKNTWMLLLPPINWSQWINHDSHSWRAQNILEFHSKLQGPPRTNLQKGLQELGSILIHLFQQDATVSNAWEKHQFFLVTQALCYPSCGLTSQIQRLELVLTKRTKQTG